MKFTLEITNEGERFRAVIVYENTQEHTALLSPFFLGTEERRIALDVLFDSISIVIRQRAFPKDTKVYKTVTTKRLGAHCEDMGYPEENRT